jgi:hypothetical protein
MPYKSDAQRRFFHAAEARGDIKPSTVDEFDKASKGMKLPEHVKKLYEGGLIDGDEYADFQARYHTSEGEEKPESQEMPSFESEEGSKHTEHHESPLPSQGFDEYMTQQVGEEYKPSFDENADMTSREEFAREIKRNKRREMFRGGYTK